MEELPKTSLSRQHAPAARKAAGNITRAARLSYERHLHVSTRIICQETNSDVSRDSFQSNSCVTPDILRIIRRRQCAWRPPDDDDWCECWMLEAVDSRHTIEAFRGVWTLWHRCFIIPRHVAFSAIFDDKITWKLSDAYSLALQKQEAQLSQRDCAMLPAVEYFAESFNVIRIIGHV